MRTNYVYFMWDNVLNRVKIGQSHRPEKRRRELQRETGHDLAILATIEDQPPLEYRLHQQFDEFRLTGEWFSPADDIMEYIDKHEGRPDLQGRLMVRAKVVVSETHPLIMMWLKDKCTDSIERAALIFGVLLGIFGGLGGGIVCWVYAASEIAAFIQASNFNRLAGAAGLIVGGLALIVIPPLMWLAALSHYVDRRRSRFFSDN